MTISCHFLSVVVRSELSLEVATYLWLWSNVVIPVQKTVQYPLYLILASARTPGVLDIDFELSQAQCLDLEDHRVPVTVPQAPEQLIMDEAPLRTSARPISQRHASHLVLIRSVGVAMEVFRSHAVHILHFPANAACASIKGYTESCDVTIER